jgi:histidinol-phosphate phosphatase family protein
MIVATVGYPGAGKSSLVKEYTNKGFERVNRDTVGGSLLDLLPAVAKASNDGKDVVLDNTYPTKLSRKPLIDLAKKLRVDISCVWLRTSIEDAQVNVCTRMMQKHGKIIPPEEMRSLADPGVYPPAVLFKYKNEFEEPTVAEGFLSVEKRLFVRSDSEYKGKALILDYDGTLRETKSGAKYPSDPDDIRILPNRRERLLEFKAKGYRLLGASNQGDIGRGKITVEQAKDCFERTNELLGIDIEYSFCPHNVPPVICYCRKPGPALGIQFIERYKLDKSATCMIGDMTSDETFAKRCGIGFIHADKFFEIV